MTKIIKKVTLNAPASTSTGVDPTKGTQENPYTKEEYEELCRLGLWTHGWFVEGIGIIYPDVVITSSYPYYPIEDEDDDWNNDDDWYDDGTNPHPNPSPDETGGNGGNYPPGGGGGGGNSTGGGNNGNGQNNGEGRKHHKIVIDLDESNKEVGFKLKTDYLEIDYPYDLIIFEKEGKVEANIEYDGYLTNPQIKNVDYQDLSNPPVCPIYSANALIIRNGTWKLYKELVKVYNVEWAAHYYKEIPANCKKKDGFPIGAKIEPYPDDNRECIIISVNNPTACVGLAFNGMNCHVHSHPSNTEESDPDKYEAYKKYDNNKYKLFAIINRNSNDANLDFHYYIPFNDYEAEKWAYENHID